MVGGVLANYQRRAWILTAVNVMHMYAYRQRLTERDFGSLPMLLHDATIGKTFDGVIDR